MFVITVHTEPTSRLVRHSWKEYYFLSVMVTRAITFAYVFFLREKIVFRLYVSALCVSPLFILCMCMYRKETLHQNVSSQWNANSLYSQVNQPSPHKCQSFDPNYTHCSSSYCQFLYNRLPLKRAYWFSMTAK
jgi:hypothetical protein